MKSLMIVAVLLGVLPLAGCASIIAGVAVGATVYNYQCHRWVNGPYGPYRVWVCGRGHGHR